MQKNCITIYPIIRRYVSLNFHIFTDESRIYKSFGAIDFGSRKTVNNSESVYVSGGMEYTNTIECF